MGFHVVAIDINDDTLAVCKEQGADAVFNSMTNKDYAAELKKLTNGGAKAACVFSNAQAVSGHAIVPDSTAYRVSRPMPGSPQSSA